MGTQVKLSKETIEVLKVISSVNNSLRFEAGSELKTISVDQTIVMLAEISETFPQTFSIYDLSQFLSVLSLLNDAVLDFDGDKKVVVRSGDTKIDFYFTAAEFVSFPAGKRIALPSVDLEFSLTQENLSMLTKGAALFGHKKISFKVESGKIYGIATSPDLDTSNNVVVALGDTDVEDCHYVVMIEKLKLLPGDFNAQISAAGHMRLEHTTRSVETFIGLEGTN